MSFSPDTQLAYFPAYEHWLAYAADPNFVPKKFRSNSGWGGYTGEALKKRIALQKEGDSKGSLARAAAPARQWRRPHHRRQSRDRGHHAANLCGLPRH
jgi:hypothetical protein